MAKRDPRMVHLGYGKWVRADRVYAVVGRSRVASIEAAAKQKRLADQRAREVAIRRARWQS